MKSLILHEIETKGTLNETLNSDIALKGQLVFKAGKTFIKVGTVEY